MEEVNDPSYGATKDSYKIKPGRAFKRVYVFAITAFGHTGAATDQALFLMNQFSEDHDAGWLMKADHRACVGAITHLCTGVACLHFSFVHGLASLNIWRCDKHCNSCRAWKETEDESQNMYLVNMYPYIK